MELASTIAIILSVVVALLQIWTVASLINLKKRIDSLAEEKSVPVPTGERTEPRDPDFRRTRRPQDQQRAVSKPQPVPSSSAPADPVEKSLRDINLKLKNAERDQESARKKIQDNFQREPRRDGDNSRRGGRDFRGERGGRDHRRDGREGRDNRDNRRGGWQDREPRRDFQPRTPATEGQEESTFEIPRLNEQPKPQIQMTAPPTGEVRQETPDLAVTDVGMTDENLQHGRKIMVKRRTLKEEEGQPSVTAGSVEGEPGPQNNVEPEGPATAGHDDSADAASGTEIRFGRR